MNLIHRLLILSNVCSANDNTQEIKNMKKLKICFIVDVFISVRYSGAANHKSLSRKYSEFKTNSS